MDDGHCVNENKLIKTVVETYCSRKMMCIRS